MYTLHTTQNALLARSNQPPTRTPKKNTKKVLHKHFSERSPSWSLGAWKKKTPPKNYFGTKKNTPKWKVKKKNFFQTSIFFGVPNVQFLRVYRISYLFQLLLIWWLPALRFKGMIFLDPNWEVSMEHLNFKSILKSHENNHSHCPEIGILMTVYNILTLLGIIIPYIP